MEPTDRHVVQLGALIANFQSLEYMLRALLGKLPGAKPHPTPYGVDIYTFPVGTKLPVSDLTSYASLNDLISAYNSASKKFDFGPSLDPRLVGLRDALAHGRVSTPPSNNVPRLLKFTRPRNGTVTISFNEIMDDAWFKVQLELIYDALIAVLGTINEAERRWPETRPSPT